MTKFEKKILICFKWLLRLKGMGATDNEILQALECVLEHGDRSVEVLEVELEIEKAIHYRGTTEYLNEQYRKRKEEIEKLKKTRKNIAKIIAERKEISE